jgi:hypothetical protein
MKAPPRKEKWIKTKHISGADLNNILTIHNGQRARAAFVD